MLSGFYIFNHKGELLITRQYRPDVKKNTADIFRIQVIANPHIRSPITVSPYNDTTFFHMRHENLFIATTSSSNANAAVIFEFLKKFIAIGVSYFGAFDEDAVKNNFVLVYELLDEILDYGYPQNNDIQALKMYITTEGLKSERALAEQSSKITIQATGVISWRRPDIKYRKNEAYLDVIESVNMLMSAKGAVLRSDVSGQVQMRCYLTGMPDCKLGLNDKVLLDRNAANKDATRRNKEGKNAVAIDDIQFHQCVKLGRFDAERSISFVPPDGEFELMRYRTTDHTQLPFKCVPVVNEHKTRVEYKVLVKALFGAQLVASNVVVRIPVPPNCAKTNIAVPVGKAKFASGENAIVWKIPRWQGQTEFTLSAEAELTSMVVKKQWSRPPVSMDFQVLMFTSSGLTVQYLKVFEKSGYPSVKWVRYYTKAASYQFRF